MWFTSDPTFWMPAQASNHAALVDNIYYFLYWASVISFVAVIAAGGWFVLKYRARDINDKALSQVDHSTTLELTWTLPVFGVAAVAFYFGVMGFVDMKTPPDDAYEVNVTAYKWAWAFTYANGHTDGNLHIPAGRPVKLTMASDDVLHSFFVPAFRVKQDVVPGRYTQVWWEAMEPGEYQIFCTEYCGTKHSEMLAKVIVHTEDDFAKWLDSVGNILDRLPPEEAGKLLATQRGCLACHTLDGAKGVGPTFKGAWGSTRKLADGADQVMDENYVRQSVMEPQSQIVAGYPPVMPTFKGKLDDREISAIIAFLKSLK
jgi:cytochrome c oxidase subunit 2